MGSTRMEGRANGGYDVKLRHKRMARAAYRSSQHWDDGRMCYADLFSAIRRNDHWHRQFRSVR